MTIDAKLLMNEEIPVSVRAHFVQAIKRAYVIIADHFDNLEWLNWPVGKDILRLLRRVVVEYEIKSIIDRKGLPIKYRIAPNSIDNCRHLELRTNRLVVTVSQVISPKAVPRKAVFRNNHSLCNQLPLLFPGFNDEDACIVDGGPYYALLTHGYFGREPKHIYLGVPEPSIRGWIDQINLLKEPYEMPKVEKIEEADLVKLKEHIQEVIKYG